MEIVKIPIGQLTPYEKNAKRHPQEQIEQIKESIRLYGNNDPIGVWGERNVIVEGHGRYRALKELGYEEADCIRLDNLSDKERQEYTLVHNQTTMNSGWDIDILGDALDGLDFGGFDFGFDADGMDGLDGDGESEDAETEAIEDDFDEEPPEEPKAKRGDVYRLGRHRLMCGDSTSADDVSALMGGELADLIVTDPPYNVNYGEKAESLGQEGARANSDILNDNMDSAKFYEFLLAAFKNAHAAMRDGAAIYVFHAESNGHIFREAFIAAGLKLAQCLIWEKNTFTLGRQDYQWRHEPILYGWKEGAAHYFINDRTQSTILFEQKPSRNDMHPTMKPVPLVGKLITNSSKPDWNVLDLFGGSGSTLIAAEQLSRSAYVMEMDEAYCDVIIKRWENYAGEKAIKLN